MPLFATNVESQINQLQKELLEKSNQRVFISECAIWPYNRRAKKRVDLLVFATHC